MYSKSFPDVKSPKQMGFEAKVQSIVQDDETDLDQLSPIKFLTSDEDSVDNKNLMANIRGNGLPWWYRKRNERS